MDQARHFIESRAVDEPYAPGCWFGEQVHLHGDGGDPQFDVPFYQVASRYWERLLTSARKPAMRANIAMINRLHELDEQCVGRASRGSAGLLVDGTPIVAWAQQWVSARSLPYGDGETAHRVSGPPTRVSLGS